MDRRKLLTGIGTVLTASIAGCGTAQETSEENQDTNELIVSAHVDQFRNYPNSLEADIHLTNFSDVSGPFTIHIHYYIEDRLMHTHERAVRIESNDLRMIQDVLVQSYHEEITRVTAHVEHVYR